MRGVDEKNVMYLRKSESGKGVYMKTPTKKSIIFANISDLIEFARGEREYVKFTIEPARDQQQLPHGEEGEQ